MNAVMRRVLLLVIALSGLPACSSLTPEKQWYKPGQSYTVADFERDRTACTKDRVLDEECLKARGWTALSGDEYKPPTRPITPGTKARNAY
jgi:hypothetical protein